MQTIFGNWVLLSLLAAFGQAFGWAIKKKSLENKGINNTLGVVAYTAAGLTLVIFWGIHKSWQVPHMSPRFWVATFVIIGVNVLASWAAYRALDKGALSMLMPFVALTALLIVPLEFTLKHVLPSAPQICGIGIVIVGAILFAKQLPTRDSLTAIKYFAITLVCYSIAPPFQAVAIDEVRDGLFSAMIFHMGIAIGFIPLMFMSRERGAIAALQKSSEWKRVITLMIFAGMVIALLENGPASLALETGAKASEIFGLKRTMPLFALMLGYRMFGERITVRNTIGTILLVAGSFLIVWYRAG